MYICVDLCIFVYICVYLCTFVYICLDLCTFVNISVIIHREINIKFGLEKLHNIIGKSCSNKQEARQNSRLTNPIDHIALMLKYKLLTI